MLITCQSAIFRPAIKPSPALTADILFVRNYPKQSLPTKPKSVIAVDAYQMDSAKLQRSRLVTYGTPFA